MSRPAPHAPAGLIASLALLLVGPVVLEAQRVVTAPSEDIIVVKGQSALLVQPAPLQRLSIADPEIAEVFAVSPREIMINGKELGTTSLLLWDRRGATRMYTVAVTPDTAILEQAVGEIFPGEDIRISSRGSAVIVSGQVTSANIARRVEEIAQTVGMTVINNLQAPAAPQVLLQVRFAEVSRTALRELGTQIGAVALHGRGGAREEQVETSSDGLLRLSLLREDIEIDLVIRALQSRGLFRSLAEPNLMARDNEEASFLAGGEFPFPVAQGGTLNTVTIEWKEFGVRLRFRPTILPDGVIRLAIAPEVSSLDFSSGLRFGGFQVPSLLTRRAETEVELRPGQYLAIAGLLDNSIKSNIIQIPFLGDIPILGELFRSRDLRQARTELLVLVSPRLILPSELPPPIPTGEPESWQWERPLRIPAAEIPR